MNPQQAGERYDTLLLTRVRERPLLHVPRALDEMELQAHWFAGDFGREFLTTRGDPVQVVQFGVWNREPGPDFVEAAILINGGAPERGAIELDPDARDWERHGHALNGEYENVILHVFTQAPAEEFFTRTKQHRNVPQVLLDVSRLASEPGAIPPQAKLGRCAGPLRDLPEGKVREILEGAAVHRLKRKAAALARCAELHGKDEALYQALATTLGYKSNKLPFTLLAQRLPLRVLRAAREEANALLFGVSGFLGTVNLAQFGAETRSYLRQLWDQWWPRRAELERLQIAPALWKRSGQRPANHPQRRLAALAQIVAHWPQIRALSETCDAAAIERFFTEVSDPFWDFHYTLTSKPMNRSMALVGDSRVTEMLMNVFFPHAMARGLECLERFMKLPAPLTNRPVEVAALRLFGEAPLAHTLLKSAAMQQGLLQIYEDFCLRDATDCAECHFPRQLARW